MVNSVELMQLCRLCLVKDQVNIPIFNDETDVQQIFLKISTCLPVKVTQDDNLPKKICNDCSYKLDLCYQFWNTSANSEKQLLTWLNEVGLSQEALNEAKLQKTESNPTPGLVLKQEAIEPESESSHEVTNNVSTESQEYILQQQQLPYQTPSFPFSDDNFVSGEATNAGASKAHTNNKREATLKRKRQAVATVTQPDSDDDVDDEIDDPTETKVAKTEETSDDDRDDDCLNDEESTEFAGVPSTSTDNEQPGPSGLGKNVVDAPDFKIKTEDSEIEDWKPPTTNNATIDSTTTATTTNTTSTDNDSKTNSKSKYVKDWTSAKKKQTRTRRIWKCTKCPEEFETNRKLRVHRKIHQKNKFEETKYSYIWDAAKDIYCCLTCDAECGTKEDVQRHVLTHDELYTCAICNLTFSEPYKYATHIFVHNKDHFFKCPLCDSYTTPKRTCLLSHINSFHLKRFIYTCSTCGKGFNDCVQFKEHNNIHKGVRPFECIVCGKDFPFSIYLHTHQVRNHRVSIDGVIGTNQCYVCMRNCANPQTLKRHIKKHAKRDEKSGNEKKHLCDMCGKGFAVKYKLILHYRTHTGDKPYSCSYCAKGFTKRDYLIMHERIHSGEKPYSCEYCGKCFNQTAPLRVHIRSHTGERPFVCHICNSKFISKGALNIHIKRCTGSD